MKRRTSLLFATPLALLLCLSLSVRANAQANDESMRTFYLANSLRGNDTNEILVAMRNMLDPHAKIYLLESQNAIVVKASSDQMALVEKMLKDLDHLHKTYRLKYTITDIDNGKTVGTEHYSMIVIGGEKTSLKQGSKVPVITGTYNSGSGSGAGVGVQTQFTYLDIGMNFMATLDEFATGVRLQSKIEQSSTTESREVASTQDPVVRQTVLEGTAFLKPGKPLILGSLDIPGTTRRQDVAVVMDLVE